jgi:hypothetical protein
MSSETPSVVHFVVKGKKFRVDYSLIDKELKSNATEEQLLPRKRTPLHVPFRLLLVYADTGERVLKTDFCCVSTSTPKRPICVGLGDETSSLLESGICVYMRNGTVSMTMLSLDALSGYTSPKNRKFSFKLTCEHEKLRHLPDMNCLSVPFVVVSRYPKGSDASQVTKTYLLES